MRMTFDTCPFWLAEHEVGCEAVSSLYYHEEADRLVFFCNDSRVSSEIIEVTRKEDAEDRADGWQYRKPSSGHKFDHGSWLLYSGEKIVGASSSDFLVEYKDALTSLGVSVEIAENPVYGDN